MITYDEIFTAAISLPPAERQRLADALYETALFQEWPLPSQEAIEEAERRSDELDAGLVTGSPWEEVRSRVRREVGLDE